ncbi:MULTISPECIES: H-NS histone family protein [unclassified Luteibacter]|jgi:DNA-binding protein H-NS|uniref:H-NS histone family protein n=1 Tax=unclassified Luteibacter TaxID=2620188 RepID=UPI000562B1CD|nr:MULTISPECIES: H-NS histone family protein [unclassified Luteibacter]
MAIDIKNLNLNQLSELIAKAQSRQNEMRKDRISDLRDKINGMIKAEGLTFDEVFGVRAPKSRRTGTSVAAKYRNPDDAEQTWSGRGKRPRWFNDALKAGKKESDLLA